MQSPLKKDKYSFREPCIDALEVIAKLNMSYNIGAALKHLIFAANSKQSHRQKALTQAKFYIEQALKNV